MNDNDIVIKKHSKKVMASYGIQQLVFQLLDGVIVLVLFFFYEAEVGLNSWLTALGLVIYAVWDAVNDPLVGYITDRPFKFTKKWGRRFPWILLAYIPWIISFLLIFSPPNVSNQWIIFGWLAGTLCAYDFLESVVTVNFTSLFPDKFRNRSERLNASAFVVYIGFLGVILAFVIPPVLIVYGNLSTYALMAWVCVIVSLSCWIFTFPGVRDDKENVERYLAKYDETQRESFFKVLRQTLKQKSFVMYLVMIVLYLSLTHLMTGSLLYFVKYILKRETGTLLIITLLLLLGGFISIPFWLKINKKLDDNRKTILIAGTIMVCFAFQFTLYTDLTLILIIIFIFGFGVGGYWVMLAPIFSQIVDESVVTYEKRREGIYAGIRNFFANFCKLIQAVTIAIVHELTGFVEGSDVQSPLALIGIRLHMGLIPAIYMGIGLLVFWKFYDITPEKSKQMKAKIIELGL